MSRADRLGLVFALVAGGLWFGFGASPWIAGACVTVFVGVMAWGIAHPPSSLLVPTISHGPRRGSSIALTFDDGPDPDSTPQILRALEDAGAKATFFVIGESAEAHPDLMEAIVSAGHELGNHSHEHAYTLNFRRTKAMSREIARGEAAILRFQAEPRKPLYRPPVGLKNPPLSRIVARDGLAVVTWSLHGRDTGSRDAAGIAQRVVDRARPGDIVLLHDGPGRGGRARAATRSALPLILAGLASRGLSSVTVSTLLAGVENAPNRE